MNFKNDRETDGYTALDYVNAIVSSLNRYNKPQKGDGRPRRHYEIRQLLTHLVYLEGGQVSVDAEALNVSPTVYAKSLTHQLPCRLEALQ